MARRGLRGAFVLVLTGQYREILPEPARPEYSETDSYSADETATKVALSTPRLANPLMPVSGTVADAGDSSRRLVGIRFEPGNHVGGILLGA